MDQGSNKNRSPAYNFTPTVTKFCVMWEGLSLPHDTKFGNCRCKIVDSRSFHSWSLIHGLRWSGLIKVGPGHFKSPAFIPIITALCRSQRHTKLTAPFVVLSAITLPWPAINGWPSTAWLTTSSWQSARISVARWISSCLHVHWWLYYGPSAGVGCPMGSGGAVMINPSCSYSKKSFKSSSPWQNGRKITDNDIEYNFASENLFLLIFSSLKTVPWGVIVKIYHWFR